MTKTGNWKIAVLSVRQNEEHWAYSYPLAGALCHAVAVLQGAL